MFTKYTNNLAVTMSQKITLLEIFYYVNFAVGILIPQEKHVCPGEKVEFTCEMDQGIDILRWRINYMNPSISSIQETFIVSVHRIGDTPTDTNNIGQSFFFNLTSTTPLISTLSVTILQAAMVQKILITCDDGSANADVQATSIIHIIMDGRHLHACMVAVLLLFQ